MNKKQFQIFLALFWTRNIIVLYTRVVLYRLTNSENIAFGFEYALFVLAILIAMPFMARKIRLADILLYIVLASFYIFSMEKSPFPAAQEYLQNNAFDYLCTNLPMLFVGTCFVDDDYIKFLKKVSFISILANVLCFVVMGTTGMNLGDDNMGLSYYLLPHVGIMLYFSLADKKKIDIAVFLLGVFMSIIYGTRGPVLSVGVTFIAIWLLLNVKKLTAKQYVGIGLGVVLLIVIWQLMPLIGAALLNSGFSNRVIEMAVSGEFASDFGRDMIRDVVMEQIERNPAGYGLAYDRLLTDYWGVSISYSHNIVLELWISFGVIIGSLIFAFLLFHIYRGIKAAPTKDQKGFILVLLCGSGMLRLFLSGTFLQSPELYLMIGVCIGEIRQKKTIEKQKKLQLSIKKVKSVYA